MWYVIGVAIVLLLIFLWWVRRPLYRQDVKREEFERFFRDFLNQMADGAVLIIEHQDSSRFIQFAKYCPDRSHTILHFGFPDAPWSRQYFDPLTKVFQTLGIDFSITTGEGLIHRFLEIDFEKEDLEHKISRGAHIARVAFEVMGLDENAKYRIHFKGNISNEAARPALLILRDHPSKLVRILSGKFLRKIETPSKDKE